MKTAQHISSSVRRSLTELRRRLEALYGDRLVRVVLYGSHARGEVWEGSDVDVMVVLRGEVHRLEEIERLSHETYPLLLEHEELISVFPIAEHEYETRRSPLLINVHREGIEV